MNSKCAFYYTFASFKVSICNFFFLHICMWRLLSREQSFIFILPATESSALKGSVKGVPNRGLQRQTLGVWHSEQLGRASLHGNSCSSHCWKSTGTKSFLSNNLKRHQKLNITCKCKCAPKILGSGRAALPVRSLSKAVSSCSCRGVVC